MGVTPFYKRFKHDGVARAEHGDRLQRSRLRRARARSSSTTAANEAAAQLKPGDFDWKAIFGGGVRWFHSGGIFAALSETTSELIIEACRRRTAHGAVVSFDLNYREKLWSAVRRRRPRRRRRSAASSSTSTCSSATKRTCRRASASPGPRSRPSLEARPERLLRHDRAASSSSYPADQGRRDDAARGALDQPPHLERGRVDQRADVRRADLRARRLRSRRRRRRLRVRPLLRAADAARRRKRP